MNFGKYFEEYQNNNEDQVDEVPSDKEIKAAAKEYEEQIGTDIVSTSPTSLGNYFDQSDVIEESGESSDRNIIKSDSTGDDNLKENEDQLKIPDGIVPITREQMLQNIREVIGTNENGEPKVTIKYRTYALEDPEDSEGKETIYDISAHTSLEVGMTPIGTTAEPSLDISMDPSVPGFYTVDIIFDSFDNPELKFLWAKLQQFKKKLVTEPNKSWLFFLLLQETAKDEKNRQLRINVLNPVLFYLTRSIPGTLSTDEVTEYDGLQGGNVIRMLIQESLFIVEEIE